MATRNAKRWRADDWWAFLLSLFIHLGLGVLLLFGLPGLGRPLPAPPVVMQGQMVQSPTQRLLELEAERARLEAERLAAEKKAREEAQSKAREEAERVSRLEAERQAKIEAERQAREQKEREVRAQAERQAKIEAEKRAQAAAEKRQKEEAERKAKELAEKKAREEAERKKKQAEEEKRRAAQAAREADLAKALANEEELIAAEQDAVDRLTYGQRIAEHIRKQWVRPAGAAESFSCVLSIQQSRFGDVRSRRIIQSCGNDFLDNSVLEAVDRASPLPLPRNSRVFDAELRVTFEPLR